MGLAARYIREFCDIAFTPSSYAFRARDQTGRRPDHHLAFEQVWQARQAAPGRDLYVAECDIRGFFDTVDHSVARLAFRRVMDRAGALRDDRVDPRAEAVFLAYLDCYNFPRNVIRDATPALREEDPQGSFPWPRDALENHHVDPLSVEIGVPQGGAISCIIANMVLDSADQRIQEHKRKSDPNLLYLRYCDDMMLVSSNKKSCQRAFRIYLDALDEHKLPYHLPEQIRFYDKTFWRSKSKNPYCWTGKHGRGRVPWVQFVGYQVRYDGLVRTRPKSVKKQMRKIRNLTDKVKFGLINALRLRPTGSVAASRQQVCDSQKAKLIASAVGKITNTTPTNTPQPLCWAAGFRALSGKPIVTSFLKRLDQVREKQIRRMHGTNLPYGEGVARRSRNFRPNIAGHRTSYFGQFNDSGGRELISHPYRSWAERYLMRPMSFLKMYLRRIWLCDKASRTERLCGCRQRSQLRS